MGEWQGGGFSDIGFSSGGFNTGIYVDEETMAPPDRAALEKSRFYYQVQREDEEILAIIMSAAKSGIFEE